MLSDLMGLSCHIPFTRGEKNKRINGNQLRSNLRDSNRNICLDATTSSAAHARVYVCESVAGAGGVGEKNRKKLGNA